MQRKYVKVKPSRERLNPDDIVSHLSSFHKLNFHGDNPSIREKLNPFDDDDDEVPRFEFLAISQGKDAPVEFFYGADEEFIETLRKRLVTAYPESFDVETVEIDVLERVVPPVEYDPEEFVENLIDGELQYDVDEVPGSVEDLTRSHTDIDTGQDIGKGDEPLHDDTETESGGPGGAATTPDSGSGDAVDPSQFGDDVDEEVIEDAAPLAELNGEVLKDIDVMSNLEGDVPVSTIDGPTKTEDGTILARPSLENGTPVASRWRGEGERKKDWMTTMKMFSNVANPEDDDIQSRAPLATLIQHLAESDLPIAFQVVFERMEDWTRLAEKRKDDLHLDRDTVGQKILYEVGELVHGSSEERRREKRRNYFEEMGESGSGDESAISGDVGKRAELIDNKIPKRTFRVNIRSVSIATGTVSPQDVRNTMNNLSSVLDHLDGYFYGLNAKIMEDTEGGLLSEGQEATKEFHKLVNREMEVSGRGKMRKDVVMNADELANFISVPSSKNLTVEGSRGTRAEAESRNPLPRPDPDLMEQFHSPGMRIGYALDEDADPEEVPTQLPPSMLTKHFGRFATTGAGKSKALINDMLSLYENTEGPIVFIDPKGDGMTQNYMKAHFDRFGEKDLKENVVHFPVPDILPGFTFFDIRPALNQGKRRVDAVQNKADHYEELLKLVMGAERYRESKVAPTIIKALIKSLFDEDHAMEQYSDLDLDRESKDAYSHNDLERAAEEMRKYVSTDDDSGSIPEVADDRLHRTLTRHTESDPQDFATIMDALFNRLDYIREDYHLRQIFDNTEKRFDFRDHLNESKVIMFDLGELRDEATVIMTGLILMNIWDALKEHSRTKCTVGHETEEECREYARRKDIDPIHPPCHEPWGDDHLVNLIVDEAASVAVSDIMNKMLEQGRSFHLGVGLSMQYPEQMKDAGERTYRNVLNNVASLLIGKITLDEEIAEAMAHEDMTPEEFSNRIKSLPRGEWIAQLPSPKFQETGPEPFSLDPLPIPAGHPESPNPLDSKADDHFQFLLDNVIHQRTQEQYGVASMDHIDSDDESSSDDTGEPAGAEADGEPEDEQPDPDDVQLGITGEQQGEAAREPLSGMPEHILFQPSHGYKCERCESTYAQGRKAEAAICCLRPEQELPAAASVEKHPARSPETDEATASAEAQAAAEGGQQATADAGTATQSTGGGSGPGAAAGTGTAAGHAQSEQATGGDAGETMSPYAQNGGGGENGGGELDPGTPDGVPIKPLNKSDLNGPPGSYDKADIDHEKPVTKISELELVFEDWNRSAILAVGARLASDIPSQHSDVLTAAFKTLTGHANIKGIEYQPDESLTVEHLNEAAKQNFEAASINLNASELVKNYHETDEHAYTSPTEQSGAGSTGGASGYSSGPDEPAQTSSQPYGNSGSSDDSPDDGSSRTTADTGYGNAASTPGAGSTQAEPSDIKLKAPNLSPSEIQASDLAEPELGFLATVLAAMNNNLRIDRMNSLSRVRDTFEQRGADIEKLKADGYVIEHHIGKGRGGLLTYTVTPKGRKEINMELETGPSVGDLGDGMPHRYGADLTMKWLSHRADIAEIDSFKRPTPGQQDDEILDIIGYNHDGQIKLFVEVEGGASKAEKEEHGSEDTRPGINDYSSFRKDHELMAWAKDIEIETEDGETVPLAADDAEAIWVVRNKAIGRRIVRALAKEKDGKKLIDLPVEDADRRYQNLSADQFNALLNEHGEAGVDAIYTFDNIKGRLPR